MHNTCTGAFSDEGGAEDLEAAVSGSLFKAVEEGLVALTDDGCTLKLVQNDVVLDFCLLADVAQTILHADVNLLCG